MVSRIKSAFAVGIIILFMIGVAWFIVNIVTSAADKIWLPIFQFFGWQEFYTRSAIGSLILTFALAVLIGFLLKIKFLEREIFGKMPIIRGSWKWAKGVSDRIGQLKGLTPVYVEYLLPAGKFEWIGFMTGIQEIEIRKKSGMVIREKRVKVFIPNSPVPVTGQGFFVSPARIIGKITNSFDEIMTILLSGTAVSPQKLIIEEIGGLNEEEFKMTTEFINLKRQP